MKNASAFWNSWAKRYAKQPVADQEAYENKLKQTQALFDTSHQVLEFGCGTGSTALVHSPYVQHIRCIDFSENMIAIAQQKTNAQSIGNVSFEVNTLETLDAKPQSYDVILGLSVLHLLEDWQGALEKVYSLLKPGGHFVSSTPCLNNVKWLSYIAPVMQPFGLMPQLTFFSQTELASAIKKRGLAIEVMWQTNKKAAVFIIAKKQSK
jgi:2-polyprenyl-3-methyl-5-hydroxy-6-metoxy-1,4-benzoquinol methylase